ncbi:MAG: hypothetical protein IKL73_00180 [Lachnospiraceae bacterium]|nr:hypothetical protein [Lachnospira sp.]MBR6696666.1 hypothetical protein [Lachnospiraceae bacterium]
MSDKRIDDIVSMLDDFMNSGGGHMNVTVGDNTNTLDKTVVKTNSTECAAGNLACQVPTLHEGLDAKE